MNSDTNKNDKTDSNLYFAGVKKNCVHCVKDIIYGQRITFSNISSGFLQGCLLLQLLQNKLISQTAFTCSKSTLERPE